MVTEVQTKVCTEFYKIIIFIELIQYNNRAFVTIYSGFYHHKTVRTRIMKCVANNKNTYIAQLLR